MIKNVSFILGLTAIAGLFINMKSTGNENPIASTALSTGGQVAFTESFMKYVNDSYYSVSVLECFDSLCSSSFKKIKRSPGYMNYKAIVELHDFDNNSILYSEATNLRKLLLCSSIKKRN